MDTEEQPSWFAGARLLRFARDDRPDSIVTRESTQPIKFCQPPRIGLDAGLIEALEDARRPRRTPL
jgi:hypothetical protein